MHSVQEDETGSGSINGKDAIKLCNAPHEMGHIQGLTTIKFDNIFANSIIYDTVVQHMSKATNLCFYWLRGWCWQKQFHVNWKQEKKNSWIYIKT